MPTLSLASTEPTTRWGEHNQIALQGTRQAGLDDPWWHAFNDPTLDALIDHALDHNHDILGAAHAIDAAAAELGMQRLKQWMPEGSLRLDREIHSASAGATNRAASGPRHRGSVDLTQAIDLWGMQANESAVVEARLQMARAARQELQQKVVSTLVRAYWQNALLRQTLPLAQANLRDAHQRRALAEGAYTHGATDVSPLIEARRQVVAMTSAIVQRRQELAQSEHAISLILGDAPRLRRFTNPVLPDVSTVISEREIGIPADVLRNRPDLRRAEWRLRSTFAELAVSRLSLYPRFSLTAQGGGASEVLMRVVTQPVGSLAAAVVFPLFEWPERLRRIDRDEARLAALEAVFIQTLHGALAEVEDALVERQRYADERKLRDDDLLAAQQLETIAWARHRAGSTGLAAALESREFLRQARMAWLNARFDQAVSVSQLHRALGWPMARDDVIARDRSVGTDIAIDVAAAATEAIPKTVKR